MHDSKSARCPECGAALGDGTSCLDNLHDLLALESQLPDGPDLLSHFYAVSSYNLQHPGSMRLSADALKGLRATLADVLDGRITLGEARRRAHEGARTLGRVTRRAGDVVIVWDVTQWPITVKDICDGGRVDYAFRVERWARSVLKLLPSQER